MALKLLLIAALCCAVPATGQQMPGLKKLDNNTIPTGLVYEGKLKNGFRWIDQSGDNIFFTTETGIYRSDKFAHESEGGDAELFAYHFIFRNDSLVLQRKIYDFVSDCPVDIEASFMENFPLVTDLDHDGTAEIWVMYQTACHGDISPLTMKIIMSEGSQKYALRGESRVAVGLDDAGNKEYIGGGFKADEAFIKDPEVFLTFARNLWEQQIKADTGEQ